MYNKREEKRNDAKGDMFGAEMREHAIHQKRYAD